MALETIVPSAEPMKGRVEVNCGFDFCKRVFYLPPECLDEKGRIKKDYEIDGLFISKERYLYCSQDCYNKECED